MLSLAFLLLFHPQLRTMTASDYSTAPRFLITGEVVVGRDEPVRVDLKMTESRTGVVYSTRSFANGSFRFTDVLLGTYLINVTDPRFDLYTDQILFREAEDTSKTVIVRLVRRGESPNPPSVDPSSYTIDADTAKTVPAAALDEYNKGLAALRNPDKKNPADVHFKKAIESAPKFYEAHLQLGLELQHQKKDGDAISALEEAAAIKPTEPRPLSVLAELYSAGEKYDKVVETLSKLQELGKMGPRDHFYLGSAFFKQDKLDKAEEELLAAINTGNDTDPEPFLQLHNVFMKEKQPVRALAVLEDFLKTFPNHPNHAAMADRAKALRQALRLPPPR